MISMISFSRSIIELAVSLGSYIHCLIRIIKISSDLVIFIVTQNCLNHRHDLSNLVYIVQSSDVLCLFWRDSNIDRNSVRNFNDICFLFPSNAASCQSSTSCIQSGCYTKTFDISTKNLNIQSIAHHSTGDDIIYFLSSNVSTILYFIFILNVSHKTTLYITIYRCKWIVATYPYRSYSCRCSNFTVWLNITSYRVGKNITDLKILVFNLECRYSCLN